MSSATSLTPSNKASISPATTNYSQASSGGGLDLSQKRSNSSGSYGPGLQARQAAQSRSQQVSKKPNKAQKRAKILDDGAADEIAAMRSINSRKGQTSITHLMNFSLPPRPQYQPQHLNHRPHQRYNKTWGLGSGYHAVDKAKYVHANYRFIVRPDREYHAQTVDADVHVGWDAVLQILASADTQSTNCPICLSVPVAPRMAKCGHICCLPCLIRYMHSTDDTTPNSDKRARWKKCPICEDSIYTSEVRPVRWFSGQEASMLREGGDVLLRLLKRHPGSTLALPRDAADGYGQHEDIPWFHIAEIMDYARFMKAGEEYMIEQYDQEILALEEQEREDELMFGDDTTWTRKAISTIKDAKQRIQGLPNPPSVQPQPSDKVEKVPESWDEDQLTNGSRSELTNSMARLSFGEGPSQGPRPRAPFYFYGALPNFYLSPLDIRVLKAAFGDFANFPSTILPRVEHISTGHLVDDELRKRAKYMGHLPHGAEVSMLECDWTDIISPSILEQFNEDIVRRRRRNHEKEAREERDRLRAEKEEDDRRWAATRRKRPSINESLSEADFTPLQNMAVSPSNGEGLAQTPPWSNQRAQSAFATLASPGTSPEGPRTVWGTAMIGPSTPDMPVTRPQQSADDGWLQDWERDLLDEVDAVALVAASTGEGSSKHVVPISKKNKKKKITLMSTNVRRGA
ncbi:hypothetical protein LTR64_003832 [Lithohypha guttulata]|uniref:RING-type domain-containing protein n=1 Tax=Lithohypha guttulata TaxID=1690604 RepID=A0AAN7T6F5_9EURO|nr:hypothetical protein LTR51_006870 [Lithohypha guttulata]KAK5089089.1 hypothetical protein LTR05_003313 [Lithohypha guttulata]